MSELYNQYLALRAAMPPRPKRWAEIGLTERPIHRESEPVGKPVAKSGWHRDRTTGKKMK